jgi:hypothetical protein
MKMWDALADTVVDCYECALGPKSLFDGTRQQLRVRKQRTDEPRWQVAQSREVLFRKEQTMPRKNWAMVQKGQGTFIFKHPLA